MSSGAKTFIKILVAVVTYAAVFALAIYGIKWVMDGGRNETFGVIILVILWIFGFGATRNSPHLVAHSSGTESIPVNLFFISMRVVFAIIAGVFIAPWKIAKALTNLIP